MDEDNAHAKPSPKRGSTGRRDTRELGRVVRRYLGALEASRSSKGKRRNIEAVQSRLLKIDELLVTADPLARLHMTQERIDLHADMVRLANGELDLSSLEKDFIRVAKSYGDTTGVTYAAWRQVGVDTEVLDQAGIVRVPPTRPDASRSKRPPAGADVDGPPEPLLETPPASVSADPEPELVLESTPEPLFEAPAPEVPAAEAAAEDGPPKKVRRKRIADAPTGDAS
jgi:hypothetical protein